MHFIDSKWLIKSFNIGLMKMEHTNGEALKTIFEGECEKYGILEKTIAFVSDEGKNLETCIKAFETSIQCAGISSHIVQGAFRGLCNAHMISKSIGWVFVKQDKDTPTVDSDLSLIDVQSAKKKTAVKHNIYKEEWKGQATVGTGAEGQGTPPYHSVICTCLVGLSSCI